MAKSSIIVTPLFHIILFFIAAVVLIRSGSIVVARLSRVAHFLQMSEFAVSFVLIALATSLPDIFVSLSAAFHGTSELAFSNIIGANIVTLTLAAGIGAVLARGLDIKSATIRTDTLYAAFAVFLPVLLLLDKSLSWVDGIILLSYLTWYFTVLLQQRERFTKIFSNSQRSLFNLRQFFKDFTVLAIATAVLIGSAEAIIRFSFAIAEDFNIDLPVIGMLLVALSITLPEIVFSVRAILMGHKEMVFGNLIGSVIINSGFAIGAAVLIDPIEITTFAPFAIGMLFTALIAILFPVFVYTKQRISFAEGVVLVSVYALFVTFVLLTQGYQLV